MTMLKLVCLACLLIGCAGSFAGRAPETRTLTLASEQAHAYEHAMQVLRQMGTQITTRDGYQEITGLVHNAVVLHVHLKGHPGHPTTVTVTGSIPPGKLTLGAFTELDEFCTRLTALETAHAR